jgi:hypothetical protein
MKLSNIIINKITFALFSLVIIIYLGLCSIENGGNESKKYLGLLSYLSNISNRLANASIIMTGVIQDESGLALTNASLSIEYSMFSISGKEMTSNSVFTDTTGFFTMNLSVGTFTIYVTREDGTALGSFTVFLESDNVPPRLLSISPLLRVISLTSEPYEKKCQNCTPNLTGISSSPQRLFLYANYNTSDSLIYESYDGINFKKYLIKLNGCISSHTTSEYISCELSVVAYENGTYIIIGQKKYCSTTSIIPASTLGTTTEFPNPNINYYYCSTLEIYYAKTQTLESLIISSIQSPIAFSLMDQMQPFVLKNGIIHILSKNMNIFSTSDGLIWTNFGVSNYYAMDLYLGDGDIPVNGLSYYFSNLTWNPITFSQSPSLFLQRIGYFNLKYNAIYFDQATSTIQLFQSISGSTTSNLSFSTNPISTYYYPNVYTLGPLFPLGNGFISLSKEVGYDEAGQMSSTISGLRYDGVGALTSFKPSFPTDPGILVDGMGYTKFGDYFYAVGSYKVSVNNYRTYLLKSLDAENWNFVGLPY